MAGKFARSWELTKQSWAVLKDDKKLMIFPIISGTMVTVLVGIGVAGIVAVIATQEGAHRAGDSQAQHFKDMMGPAWYAAIFAFYLVTHFVVTFFQSALMSCAITKFEGGRPTIQGGLKSAAARLPQIFGWSLVNATVGMVLQILKERVGFIGKLLLGGVGIVWNIATFFVVPVLVVEGVGPIEAVKRSTAVIKKTWGESLITQFGFSAVTSLIGMALLFVLVGAGIGLSMAFGAPWPMVVFVPLALVAVLLLAIVQSAMKTVLIAATYRYAATGQADGAFDAALLQGMFKQK